MAAAQEPRTPPMTVVNAGGGAPDDTISVPPALITTSLRRAGRLHVDHGRRLLRTTLPLCKCPRCRLGALLRVRRRRSRQGRRAARYGLLLATHRMIEPLSSRAARQDAAAIDLGCVRCHRRDTSVAFCRAHRRLVLLTRVSAGPAARRHDDAVVESASFYRQFRRHGLRGADDTLPLLADDQKLATRRRTA